MYSMYYMCPRIYIPTIPRLYTILQYMFFTIIITLDFVFVLDQVEK